MLRRFEQFSLAVSGIYHWIQQIERDEMERYGLKGPHAQYLMAMDRYPGGITVTQLGEICDRDKAAVSRAVAEMESRGLLIRDKSGETAYRALLILTPLGREAAGYVCDRVRVAVSLAGQGVTDEERAVLYSALERIAANIRTISREGLPDCVDGVEEG